MMNDAASSKAGAAIPKSSGKGMKGIKRQKWIFLLLAVGPAYAGYLLFTLYPNFMSVFYAFMKWDGISKKEFVGLDNFVFMFKDEFVWRALSHNLVLMIVLPILTTVISLVLAHLLINKGFREAPFYKVIFFLPNVLSTVVITLLWIYIYDGSNGLLNGVFRLFGYDNGGYYWLSDPKTALWLLLPPMIWGGVGFYVIIFMNAMKGIPKSMYEAAILEGASHFTRLHTITIPLINPVIRITLLFLFLGGIKSFEIILVMTNGGPAGSTNVIGLYMFNQAFSQATQNYGYASAIGLFLFVILVGGKVLIDRLVPKSDWEY
ncbi:carbohydrate ABC transporter permease [Paenibacillus eucommiae]|uniref:ABC-type sugar transport system permease subunit n=1 Tax=Paenibacillus eucommiae TaxID=1355755 RepID=A0ABS4ILU3_9BACL|nr:sugar ABC transporter permease [Paenibacillus eucommiae]MBP1988527.1 ABC-type sugar transport system permease subunit [Paenibacillus eucommiae]